MKPSPKERSKWDFELAYGEKQETAVLDLLWTGRDKVRFEIKSDRKAHETGNIFIETQDGPRTSGLMVSTADWVVYDIAGRHGLDAKPKVLLFMERESLVARLQELVRSGRLRPRNAKGSDQSSVWGLVVPILDALGVKKK